jgi:hypothetical protein
VQTYVSKVKHSSKKSFALTNLRFHPNKPNRHLSKKELLRKVVAGRRLRDRLKLHVLSRNKLCFRLAYKLDLHSKISEDLCRLDIVALQRHLIRANELGKLTEAFVEEISDRLKNRCASDPRGKRYSLKTRLLYETLLSFGGPRSVKLLAANKDGPAIRTVQQYRTDSRVVMLAGIDEGNFANLARIYEPLVDKLNLRGSVPLALTEDETSVLDKLQWRNATDSIEGACGVECALRCRKARLCHCADKHR